MVRNSKKSLELSFKIERSNEFNQLSPKGLNLTQVRFLAIYQAKINARNPETRTVTFPISEFCKIMEINQLTVTHIKSVADDIICKPVHLPSTSGKNGFTVVPLFDECEVYQYNRMHEWFVKIRCHEKVLPYMFQMKKNYFTYELWNALRLSSVNQVRMYEILKQYEKIGIRVVQLEDLRFMLGITKNQYKKFNDFKVRVLEPCQDALSQHTDISYIFEPIRTMRKITALKFTIKKNPNFKDDLKLKEFINPSDLSDLDVIDENTGVITEDVKEYRQHNTEIEILYNRLEHTYTMQQVKCLYETAQEMEKAGYIKSASDYIALKYKQIKMSVNIRAINDIYRYTNTIINNDIERFLFGNGGYETEVSNNYDKPSYNLDEYIENLNKYY